MREFVPTLVRNKGLIGLFVLMVLVPAFAFSVLIVRAIRNEELGRAYEEIARQRQVVKQAETDLNAWLFASGTTSARSHAILRFEVAGNEIRFPDMGFSLPAAEAPGVRPFESAPTMGPLTADVVANRYYPRILAFLRDAGTGRHTGAQHFLRLRALIVRPPGSADGYVVDVQHVLDHLNHKVAQLCAGESFAATVWMPDTDRNKVPTAVTYGLLTFPFFELAFENKSAASLLNVRRSAFVYAMTLLVAVAVLGSLFVHRALSQEVRLSHLRNEFVAAVSHEFRSPLSSILALAERLVANRSIASAQLAEYHRIIERDARRLSALVARLLEFGRIDEGKAGYSLAAVDLVSVLHDAVDSIDHVVPPGRLRLAGVDAGPLRVRADRTALSHAIQNLIENAAKYSPPDSPIDAVCRSDNGWHVVEVRDRGVGIPADEHARIFEKFYRGRDVADQSVQGLGIGLALVKHVMDLHGGTVTVDSRPGEGSRFCLRLPAVEG